MDRGQQESGLDELAANITNLATFLARYHPRAKGTTVWGDGMIHLQVASFLTDDLPPTEYVTSVRAVVFRDDSVLAFRDQHGVHVLPGGRRERVEALEETLRRELLEETGWRIAQVSQLGCTHFHHLTPEPRDYPYPYPDFLQIVYLVEAVEFVPEAKIPDEFVEQSFFHPISHIRGLGLAPGERLFLDAAIRLRRKGIRRVSERSGH